MGNNILKLEYVFMDEELKSKEEVLNFIAEQAKDLKISNSKNKTLSDLLLREEMTSTGLLDGFAIPHTQSNSITNVSVLVIKNETEIPWETFDNSNVSIIISLLVPKDNEDNIHLQLLSELSRKLSKKEFRSKIKETQNKDDLFELMNKVWEGGDEGE